MVENKFIPNHLGKTSDGGLMTPYITPDTHDPSLLQPIERDMNRVSYGITNDLFEGIDIWNCYETTFLNERGYPITGITRIIFNSSTHYIVESKSLKLYLNSFNMERFEGRWYECIKSFTDIVQSDLTAKVSPCDVMFLSTSDCDVHYRYNSFKNIIIGNECKELDSNRLYQLDLPDNNKFTESPELLRLTEPFASSYLTFKFSGLRSNCRVTNQPDYADVYVYYNQARTLATDSLLQYLISFRKENHFHEEVVEMIFKRLTDLDPAKKVDIAVAAFYTRRGGIDISPIRYSPQGDFKQKINYLRKYDPKYFLFKNVRQ